MVIPRQQFLQPLQAVADAPLAEASGRRGGSRSGCWHRQCQSSQICSTAYAAVQNPRCQPQTVPVYAPHQRCGQVPQFVGQCLFAETVIPRINACAALTPFGPSRPRQRRPSASPQRRSLPLLQGASSLPSAALQSPPSPRFQTASTATLRFAPCPMALPDS